MSFAASGLDREYLLWEHTDTSHKCPTCGQRLTRVDASTMLVCNEGHGPYFLV